MRLYPAMQARMGDWKYYIVRMKMREAAQDISFADDIHTDYALSDAIQRELRQRRVKRDLVRFLAHRPDRFFSSLVVAAMNGEPAWHPVKLDPEVTPAVFAQSKALRESIGILAFGDDPKYYALDGQHRLKAIKLLLGGDEVAEKHPEGFEDEMISVIVMLRGSHEGSDEEWLMRYRRLFSSLNRWTKPTDSDTNIIMDEDDCFAILTRRLITEHKFFQSHSRDKESLRILTKGNSMKSGAAHFTTLRTLYQVNRTLLTTGVRLMKEKWPRPGQARSPFLQRRPSEEALDVLFQELVGYWDLLIEGIPDLREDPARMRAHDQTEPGLRDHLLFWPIGQVLFAEVVRVLLDEATGPDGVLTGDQERAALRGVFGLPWELHEAPWRHLLLVGPFGDGSPWRMRNEARKEACSFAKELLFWILGSTSGADEEGLRAKWEELLAQRPDKAATDRLWEQIVKLRQAEG